MSSMTKVKSCVCKHKFQDKQYGEGMRVHNRRKPKESTPVYRCTVCGRES